MTDTESAVRHLVARDGERRARVCSSDACRQGRDPCPCPSACETADADYTLADDLIRAAPWIAGLLVISFVLGLVAGYFTVYPEVS